MVDANAIIIVIVSLLPLVILQFTGSFIYFALLAVIAITIHGTYLFGLQIILLLLITYVISTGAELISLKTSVGIFGAKYRYHVNHPFFSSRMRILHVYPLEISLAWVILKYLSFTLATLITQAFLWPQPIVILITPLILVSLDLIIDPVSVRIYRLWQWEKGGAYFNIPLRNFFGWYAVGLAATLLFSMFDHKRQITFNVLYLLPVIFYGSFIKNSLQLTQINKKMAIIGSFPAIFWTILSVISLVMLYIRQT